MRRFVSVTTILLSASMAWSAQAMADTAHGAPGGSLRQQEPAKVKYLEGTDFALGSNFTTANLSAPVTPVPNYGCDPSDFVGFPSGTIALIQRGPIDNACTFTQKATNAQAAGAVAAVFYNHMSGLVTPSVDPPVRIPTAMITQSLGQTFAVTPGLVLHLVRPTSVKSGKGCGDKNHVHTRVAECKGR